ncbi:MAG: DUF4832 domain-containing protein [Candidatus Cryptobacteroides sp.]|nr:DUF4832 domain-containing protein [Bacteroidales bacterium]MDY2773749.1 DUF4832 domain-containing protein [Candidatus Cryptobacteroides sp.]
MIMFNKGIYIVPLVLAAALACTKTPAGGENDSDAGQQTVKISPDRTSVLRNPLNGWTLYIGRSWDENFWTKQGYDNISVAELGTTVKVSDYASTAYLRTTWKALEPSEGNYVWRDKNSTFSKLLQSVLDRDMRFAIRIVIDGRDQGQNTPQYVFDAGCEFYDDPDYPGKGRISPYPDDPVFQEKYSKFIKELAEDLDDPDKMDFIDAFGLGKWGECHTLIYKDGSNKSQVFDWITTLYSESFRHVPLLINYHRMIGTSTAGGWSDTVPSDTEGLLDSAVEKGYSLRHDAFGMTGYYKTWEKNYAKKWNNRRPIVMEGGWITGGTHRYWIDPCGKYREGHPEDVRQGEFDACQEAKVNMMDIRTGELSWFNDAFGLFERFISEGGYRLYPDVITVPSMAAAGAKVQITHRWINLGWGYCPNNIPQWNYKYKPAFALLGQDGKLAKVFVDSAAEPSEWLKGYPKQYRFSVDLDGVVPGTYIWVVGIVDTTKDEGTLGLEIATKKSQQTSAGWTKVKEININ